MNTGCSACAILALAVQVGLSSAGLAGEPLYNGTYLPTPWPPVPHSLTRQPPPTPPYLTNPPAVIPIDVGRQLFVDDFLIAETTLKRTYHLAKYHPANPLLDDGMPFSDGVWYDPGDKQYKMWYSGQGNDGVHYATSPDGIRWTKPDLDVKPGTNLVLPTRRDSSTVWLDLETKDPKQRYKMAIYTSVTKLDLYMSADGIHWGPMLGRTGTLWDRSTFFWNPFRKLWVFSIRSAQQSEGVGRCRMYYECRDFLDGIDWRLKEQRTPRWIGADTLDPVRDDLKSPCQLYNLDCAGYESLLLGLFSVWRGQDNKIQGVGGSWEVNEIVVGYSRDGWHWTRPDRRAFCPVETTDPNAWNNNNVQSAGGCCLVVGDELRFYVSGRKNTAINTGLALLRRDGFASMDAEEAEGVLTTRPVMFSGKHLFVNIDAPAGELRVEALDEQGKVIEPYSRAQCAPVRGDKTLQRVTWTGKEDLAGLAGKPVRFRFHLSKGKLYAFWVSPDVSGASYGYVAAGGPGFTENRDTIGSAGPASTPGAKP